VVWRVSCCATGMARLWFGPALLAFSLLACGGKSFDGPGGGSATGGVGQAGAGGAATAGSSVGGVAPVGGVAQGGAPSDVCAKLSDDSATFVGVEIVNNTSETLYVGTTQVTCGEVPLFEVASADGRQLTTVADCRAPCEVVRKEGQVGCGDICRLPSALKLAPGGIYTTSWTGLDFVQVQMPKECVNPSHGADRCDRAARIRPGTFTFSAQAGSSLDCSQTLNGDCGACGPDQSACLAQGALISGKAHQAVTTVLLDETYGVYPDVAKSLPGPAPSQAGDANIASPTVKLVFTE
jgi:hypothetical protein